MDFLAYVEGRRGCARLADRRGVSTIALTATLSIVGLIAVGLWQWNAMRHPSLSAPLVVQATSTSDNDADTMPFGAGDASSSAENTSYGDQVFGTLVDRYVSLRAQGLYTPEVGQKLAQNIAASLKAPLTYTPVDSSSVRTDTDTSYKRMLTYRTDLQVAFSPLMKNKNAEFEVFGKYVDSGDPQYLNELSAAAQNYDDAAALALKVVVPRDAVAAHIAIVNALREFAATLRSMIANAQDPFAASVLLQSYNKAESDVLSAFNALLTYEKSKTQT